MSSVSASEILESDSLLFLESRTDISRPRLRKAAPALSECAVDWHLPGPMKETSCSMSSGPILGTHPGVAPTAKDGMKPTCGI